jgi:hypothetical protein
VSRPQPQASRLWLVRGLLALLTLAGLGVWHGGHCADAPVPGAASGAVMPADAVSAAAAPVVSVHRQSHIREARLWDGPAPAADSCHIAPVTTVITTTVEAGPVPPAVERTPAAVSRPRGLTPCFSPGVALTRIGVSRT